MADDRKKAHRDKMARKKAQRRSQPRNVVNSELAATFRKWPIWPAGKVAKPGRMGVTL